MLQSAAIAIASLRHPVPPAKPVEEFAITGVPGPIDEPTKQPESEIPPQPPREPGSHSEFVELPKPVLKRHTVAPIRAVGQISMGATANAKAFALFAPRPGYPYERAAGI